MPFDGLTVPDYENLEKIDRVIDLIATPAQWCKGAERNRLGQYCIRGAMIAAGALDPLAPVVIRSIHDVAGRQFRRIEEFNDHPKTAHADVIRVLDRAREYVIEGKSGAGWMREESRAGTPGGWLVRLWRRCFA